jgi:alpha-galactosidase
VRSEPLNALHHLVPLLDAATGRSVKATYFTDRAAALDDADHVLACYAVDFPASFLRTCWVMRDHGIQFVEGETATPGALLATLRHLPPLLGLVEDLKQRAPRAWLHVINNPMPRLVHGVIHGAAFSRVVGHCHGSIETRQRVAALVDVSEDDVDLFVSGINHFHLVQRATHRRTGEDLLARLPRLRTEKRRWWREADFTQWRLFEELGHLLGCGNWHNFDYVSYSNQRLFRHQDFNTWERACLGVLARRRASMEGEIDSRLTDETAVRSFLDHPEREQIFPIMRALSDEMPSYFYLSGNLPNVGHIQNLPDGAVVELPATVSRDQVTLHPAPAPLPRFFEVWIRQHLAIHELSVRAVVEGSRQAAVEAIACDPAFRDCDCSPGQLLDAMLEANQGLVPGLS